MTTSGVLFGYHTSSLQMLKLIPRSEDIAKLVIKCKDFPQKNFIVDMISRDRGDRSLERFIANVPTIKFVLYDGVIVVVAVSEVVFTSQAGRVMQISFRGGDTEKFEFRTASDAVAAIMAYEEMGNP